MALANAVKSEPAANAARRVCQQLAYLCHSHVPWCPGHRAHRKDDLCGLSSRDISENSNGCFVGAACGSGFIAPQEPVAKKFFSARFGRLGYFGVTPNVAANRLA